MLITGLNDQGLEHHVSTLFSKICDKGEGGVKNLKTWVTSIMEGPLGPDRLSL